MSQYDSEELERLQDIMYQEAIAAPEEQEREIIDVSHYVADKLALGSKGKVTAEFDGHEYTFVATRRIENFKETIYVIVVDMHEKVEKNGMVLPRTFNVSAEVDNSLSYLENLRGCVAAFLRDRIGQLRAEILPED